ncbi:MAG: BREX-1 system adenine-specific DNA-methyltransferase PglX, partial [Bacteroidaceae bacterium]|nr:BREX-1 system adenine-specific DNA-methyltransferase PglX [Bacteroidaceae bacterium]
MNKSAIQRFAIQARKDLIDGVSQRAYQYGITKDGYGERDAVTVGGRALTSDEQRQRKELVDQIVSKGYTQVMEEVAYTWFNRFIALRFMEVNNYLPSHIRVFSDSTGAFKPEILNDVLHLDLPGLNMNKVAEYIENNQTEDLYRYLLLTQCNALNESLPRMFERMGGFTELLLPNNILKQDSVLGRMVTEIPEEDWTDQVQIIGWLYQYYNTELKDDTFALLKKNVKISKERIPSATQLFTPDWIVRYMVENSLGRLWIEGHPNDDLKAEWKYYLDEVEQEADVQAQLKEIRSEYANMKPQDIKVIDPCMGSGHILVYAFDVLVQIYKTYGISERDAAKSILENNIYGLDIDDRAAQLAYFAVMMKARQYDRRIFSRGVQPHVYSIVESNGLDGSTVEYFINNDPTLQKNFKLLMEELRDAKEFGSILSVSQLDFSALYARVDEVRDDISIFREIVLNSILPLIQVADVMAQKYDAVITNPPYMGSNNMGAVLSNFVKEHYPNSKADLSTVCMEMCLKRAKKHGFYAMINIPVWMTQSSFEALRRE